MQNLNLKLDPKNDVVFIGGSTATGKTSLGVQLAKEHNGAVISADSRQIYIGMDIGTAKAAPRLEIPDTTEGLWAIPYKYDGVDHYLMDIVYPNERYTLFDFKTHAYELIKRLQSENILPIVVGGTGLYLDALIANYELKADKAEDLEVKRALEARIKEEGSQKLWQELNEIDPDAAGEIHPNNPRYIVRALELYKVTGKTKSENTKTGKPPFNPVLIGISYPREVIYQRVEDRIDIMMQQGLIEETKELLSKYDPELPSMSSLGYKEIKMYLDNELSLEEATDLFKQKTRNFAKRQITWFKRYEDMTWISPNNNT